MAAIDAAVERLLAYDAVLLPVRRGQPATIVGRDLSTGFKTFEQTFAPPAPGEVVVLSPDSGDRTPPSPVIVQCLTLPEDCPPGMSIDVPVDVVGFFLKNVAYNATDAIRVAPVILALEPIRLATPSPPAA